jgi:phage shock protein PspC (stress-responsive transcriptional regulator)
METAYSANERPHFGKPLSIPLPCRSTRHERIGLRVQDMERIERTLELLGERLQALMIGGSLVIAGVGHVMRILLVAVRLWIIIHLLLMAMKFITLQHVAWRCIPAVQSRCQLHHAANAR